MAHFQDFSHLDYFGHHVVFISVVEVLVLYELGVLEHELGRSHHVFVRFLGKLVIRKQVLAQLLENRFIVCYHTREVEILKSIFENSLFGGARP